MSAYAIPNLRVIMFFVMYRSSFSNYSKLDLCLSPRLSGDCHVSQTNSWKFCRIRAKPVPRPVPWEWTLIKVQVWSQSLCNVIIPWAGRTSSFSAKPVRLIMDFVTSSESVVINLSLELLVFIVIWGLMYCFYVYQCLAT